MLNWSTLIRRTTCMTQWTAKEQCIRIQMWLRRVIVAASLAFACLSPTVASAGAIRIFDQSASGTAQSGAFCRTGGRSLSRLFQSGWLDAIERCANLLRRHVARWTYHIHESHRCDYQGDFGGSIAVPPQSICISLRT